MALTAEQLENRRHGIGGSDAGAILGLNPYRTPLDVWQEKTGRVEPPDLSDNEAVRWGEILEDAVASEYALREGVKVRRVNRTLVHPEHPWMLAHLDRTVVGKRRVLEVKTAGAHMAGEWGEPGTDQVPEYHLAQIVHYLAVTGYESADLAVLIGGRDFRVYHIQRDEELIQALIEAERDFWRLVETDTPPEPTSPAEAAKRWPRSVEGSFIEARPETIELLRDLRAVRADLKVMKEREAELVAAVQMAIGEAEELLDPATGARLATWKTQTRRVLDSKRLQKERPDIAAQYTRELETRVFRLVNVKEV